MDILKKFSTGNRADKTMLADHLPPVAQKTRNHRIQDVRIKSHDTAGFGIVCVGLIKLDKILLADNVSALFMRKITAAPPDLNAPTEHSQKI